MTGGLRWLMLMLPLVLLTTLGLAACDQPARAMAAAGPAGTPPMPVSPPAPPPRPAASAASSPTPAPPASSTLHAMVGSGSLR